MNAQTQSDVDEVTSRAKLPFVVLLPFVLFIDRWEQADQVVQPADGRPFQLLPLERMLGLKIFQIFFVWG